jgi:DNA-binding transcriptional MerR regulator
LIDLQRILALKFLGFSLDDIRILLRTDPRGLKGALAQQKALLREQQCQLTRLLRVIEETETLLAADRCGWDDIARVIKVMQLEQEQTRSRMSDLIDQAYSTQARETLKKIPFTQGDQEKCSRDYAHLYSEAERLASGGADPGDPEGQALAKLAIGLHLAFTPGDPEVEAGLKRLYELTAALPEEEKPTLMPARPAGVDEFLDRAKTIYKERNADWQTLRPEWFAHYRP